MTNHRLPPIRPIAVAVWDRTFYEGGVFLASGPGFGIPFTTVRADFFKERKDVTSMASGDRGTCFAMHWFNLM